MTDRASTLRSSRSSDQSDVVEAALQALYARRPQVIKPGLARIEAALAELAAAPSLASPTSLTGTPTVLVAGTNGKGTTTGYFWQLAVGAGLRAGLFTSPHLCRFAERIRHSHADPQGGVLDEAGLVAELERLQALLSPATNAALSFFELSTLLALSAFRRLGSDVLALEVGLGGRWDSTNATDPAVSVITSIGLDHQEFLGTTPAAIAREKAGVMRAGRPVIWGGKAAGAPEADQLIRAEAARIGAQLCVLDEDLHLDGTRLELRLPGLPATSVELPAAVAAGPRFLQRNFALAAAAFYALNRQPAALQAAVQAVAAGRVSLPPCLYARFQRLTAAPADLPPRPLLLDVGHNPDGARALVQGLKETGLLRPGERLPGLVSILGDKAHDEILDLLGEVLAPLLLFACGSERTWRREALAARHRSRPFFPDFASAFAALPPPGEAPPGVTVVTGSVFAVGEALTQLGASPLGAGYVT